MAAEPVARGVASRGDEAAAFTKAAACVLAFRRWTEITRLEEASNVSYVITDKCLGERYATCVAVCPVDCIHPGDYQGEVFMIINPEECIDCGACLPECPIEAIVETEEESPEWAKINKD